MSKTSNSFKGFTYYGGKKRLAPWIISHFPKDYKNLHYIEPFFGGGAVFFQKERSKLETINDLDKSVFILYDQIKNNPKELKEKLELTLYHELENRKACYEVVRNIDKYSDVDVALYKLLVLYSSTSCAGHSFGIKVKSTNTPYSKQWINLSDFILPVSKILRPVQIICRDAIETVERFNSEKVLFYLDPPYPGADQNPYLKRNSRFNSDDFNKLLASLRNTKARFLLSCYKKDWMNFEGFHVYLKDVNIKVAASSSQKRQECLVTNFKNEEQLLC